MCGNERLGFCCDIINDPQKFAKGKICGNEERLIFVVVSP